MNDIPIVEDLIALNILLYDIDLVDGTLSENLLDEVRRKTTKLSHCWDSIIISVMWATLLQSFNLFVALIVTLFQQNIQLGATFSDLQWTSKKYLSEERISNPRISLWQGGLFRYQLHEWTKALPKFSNIRLWINYYPRGNLQRHNYNNLDRERCPDICISSFKHCGRTNFPLQLWSSSPRCNFYWSSWKFSFAKQNENEKLVPWNRDNNKE